MPTISVKRDLLFKALNQTFSEEEFSFLCFDFGLELDDVTSERQMLMKEQGQNVSKDVSDEIIYRIEIPANRYDLLCLEGLSVALLVFQNKMQFPNYKTLLPTDGKSMQQLIIKPDTKKIRPFAVAAVLRDITFTSDSYASFIDLQDKLHQNIARKRTLVAIGTHDLDTIQGPFTYDALPPDQIKFCPLNQEKEYTGSQIMELYSNHAQLKQYLPIIRDSPVYPVITDANGVVLSLPPIINGHHSRITLNTKNVFIEITATDLQKAKIVLDTIVTAFSYHCMNQFTCETCEVLWPDGSKHKTPEMPYRKEVINVKKLNKYIGVKEETGVIANLLTRMCLSSKATSGSDIVVKVPPTRHDILHPVDIYEDAAIAYGYNNINKSYPKTNCIAQQQPLNKLTDDLRQQIAQSGFTEVVTFSLYAHSISSNDMGGLDSNSRGQGWGYEGKPKLIICNASCHCSREDISKKLRQPFDDKSVVVLDNPKSADFQVVRTTLLPGLLKSLSSNKSFPLPIKIFEISDIVYLKDSEETGALNERRLCAAYYDKRAGFEVVHGLLDRVMQLLEVPWSKDTGYWLKGNDDETFLKNRSAQIVYNGTPIGKIGTLHPEVITAFDLPMPCSALEINIEPFL